MCKTAEGHLDHGGAGLKPLIGSYLMRDDLIVICMQTLDFKQPASFISSEIAPSKPVPAIGGAQ